MSDLSTNPLIPQTGVSLLNMGEAKNLAEQIVAIYQRYREHHSPSEAWKQTYSEWTGSRATRDPQQSWKSASGKAFESIVHAELVKQIAQAGLPKSLQVRSWSEIPKPIQTGVLAEQVWKPGTVESVSIPSQVDIAVIYEPEEQKQITRVVAVYSCKTSAAERFQQDLFWIQRFRERRIRFCFATLDESFIKHATNSSPSSPPKSVTFASALYDRVYLLTDKQIIQEPQVFRSVSDMGADIERWYQEP